MAMERLSPSTGRGCRRQVSGVEARGRHGWPKAAGAMALAVLASAMSTPIWRARTEALAQPMTLLSQGMLASYMQ
jgi:hypothetical protein